MVKVIYIRYPKKNSFTDEDFESKKTIANIPNFYRPNFAPDEQLKVNKNNKLKHLKNLFAFMTIAKTTPKNSPIPSSGLMRHTYNS